MTCEECQPLAIDLARGLSASGVGEAVQRGDVLSHIARCKRCAEWLAKQEALTEALRVAAEADASLSAPPSVEANVMAAFRARQAERQAAAASVGALATNSSAQAATHWARPHAARQQGAQAQAKPGVLAEETSKDPRVVARGWKPAWSALFGSPRMVGFAAAAAVVIVALSIVSLRSLNTPPPGDGMTNPARDASAAPDAAEASASAGTAAAAGGSTPPTTSSASPASSASSSSPVGASMRTPVAGANAAVVEVLPEKRAKGRPEPPRVGASRVGVTRGLDARRGGANEIGGPAFVLLPYVEPLRPTEMRHIMRVRMPRTFVVAGDVQAGNADGATVLADVLVGEDGTARAVRIVQ